MANELMNLADLVFKATTINQQQVEIDALRHSHGIQEQTLRVLLASSEQTLAVIRLTRVMAILTGVMIILGLAQIMIMLLKP